MGGSRQPYLYQPVTHAPFNPKAYTQSLANPTPPRPRPDGPLITFNRHPDHWDNMPYGKHVGAKMMSSGSKKRILWARKIQLGWRVLQWIVAVAVLVCVVTIQGAPETQGWILRLPPAFDLAVSTYAVWHLSRPATRHPPASNASYHAFAVLMDIGLIPFYAFTGILTKAQLNTPDGTDGRWRSSLNSGKDTDTIFQITWLVAIVAAGLHAVSLLISIYLVLMFKKIADLPPDMNPLEDNLTSRAKTKHKYKNSDMSTLVGEDKRWSNISARGSHQTFDDRDDATLRMSQTSENLMGDHRSSGISFFKSRDGHADNYSPHNPNTAGQVWHIPDPNIYREPGVIYEQSPSARESRADLKVRTQALNAVYGDSRTMSPMPNAPRITKRHSATASPIPIYDEHAGAAEESNWETIDTEADDDFDPYRLQKAVTRGPDRYETLAQNDSHLDAPAHVQPLRMNPPTPEPHLHHPQPTSPLARLSQGYHDDKENARNSDVYGSDRTETITSQTSSQYSEPSEPASQSAPGKSRFYTDLAAAMRGVRQHQPTTKPPKSVAGSVHTHLSSSTATFGGRAVPATQGDLRIKPSGTVIRKPLKSYDEDGQTGYTFAKASPSRVVSRTGADVDVIDFAAAGDLGLGGVRKNRRDVSGKVAEEGRGGGLWRRISGRVPSR